MMLGVIGAFWTRSRVRREEMGLRMALGSTRNELTRWFFAEGWVLSTLAVTIGTLIVFQWVYQNGMYVAERHAPVAVGDTWLDRPVWHFLIVSVTVYLLMIITVAIGTIFPARKVSRVNPVEALRED